MFRGGFDGLLCACTPERTACRLPPEGWWCSRDAGHEGPCAARALSPSRFALDIALSVIASGCKHDSGPRIDILAEGYMELDAEVDRLRAQIKARG